MRKNRDKVKWDSESKRTMRRRNVRTRRLKFTE